MAQLFKVIRDSEIKLSGTVVSNNCANNRSAILFSVISLTIAKSLKTDNIKHSPFRIYAVDIIKGFNT